ncbi:hypothetical protein E0K83_03740 [Gramella sp. BOM4]|nr:hypothetical protein [Christiangramia bathymodioli]
MRRILLLMIVITFAFGCKDNGSEGGKIYNAHCRLDWNTLSKIEKEKVLNEFLENEGVGHNKERGLSAAAYDLLSGQERFDHSVFREEKNQGSVNVIGSTIMNIENGTVSVYGNNWEMIAEYQAGCADFKIIDFQLFGKELK